MELGADHRAHNATERIEIAQSHSRPLSDIKVGDHGTMGSCKDCHQERVEQDGDLNGRQNSTNGLEKRMMGKRLLHLRKAEAPRAP